MKHYVGRVSAASTATPGPASGITYTVEWAQEGGTRQQSGVVPIQRWPESMDTIPFDVTNRKVPVIVLDFDGLLLFLFQAVEQFDTGGCA